MFLMPISGVSELFPQFLLDTVDFKPVSGVSVMSNRHESFGQL